MENRTFLPPQRATSMGLTGEGGGYKKHQQSAQLPSMDSPFAARMPTHPPSSAEAKGPSADEMATPEIIRPSPGNSSRQSEHPTAMFNLLATIVGGGILTLPYALSLTGVVVGIVLIALAAIAGDFSLYMLCACARRTGKTTYAKVAEVALGPLGGHVVTALLAILTMFVIVAYMVLVRDLWSGVVEAVIDQALDDGRRTQVLLVALGAVFPMCLAKDLHALRHFCYVGFSSAIILTVAITYRSIEANNDHPEARLGLKLVADGWGDIFEAFPMLCLAYMCHFNILVVHSKFVNPTRDRLKALLHGTISLSSILYLVIALGGYLYAYGDTQDDILLNFDPGDKIIVIGRLGMGVTILVAISLMVLPSRDIMNGVLTSVGSSLLERFWHKEYIAMEDGSPRSEPVGSCASFLQVAQHVGMTAGIMLFCLYFALAVPGVGIIWSICGSSVGFTISYLLPAVFYLKIRSHKPFNIRKAGAWLVVIVSVVAIVVCTRSAVRKAML